MRQIDTIADPGSRVVQDYTFQQTALGIDNLILLLESLGISRGWEVVASTTTSGHPDRTLRSRQSPWHDDLVIPPETYKGKVRVRYYATSNTTLRIRVSNHDGSITQTAGDTIFSPPNSTVIKLHLCGFQQVIWVPGAGGSGAYFFVVSAMHTPRYVQEANLVDFIYSSGSNPITNKAFKNGLFDTADQMFVHINDGVSARTIDTVSGVGATVAPRLEAVRGYAGGVLKIANPIDDPTLTDQSKWFPWTKPAAIAIPNGSPPSDANGIKYYGAFWDMVVLSQNPNSQPSVIDLDNGMRLEAITWNNASSNTAVGGLYIRTK